MVFDSMNGPKLFRQVNVERMKTTYLMNASHGLSFKRSFRSILLEGAIEKGQLTYPATSGMRTE
jgi:hypothetical protein